MTDLPTDSRSAGADLDVLWRPLRIGDRELPNRVAVSAHGTSHDPARYAAYLGRRARGGAGLIVTGAIPVHPSSDLSWFPPWKPGTEADLRGIAEAVHEHGGILFGQLHHYGAQGLGTESLENIHPLVAASSLPSPVFDVQPRALRSEEIPELVRAFADAAAAMQAAGFDGVEVHAAHGYLLHSFLSPLTNDRTDDYGGDAAGRTRIVTEVGRAVRERCGEGFPVGLKLTFEEFVGPTGITPELAARQLELIHAERQFDYVGISGAAYHALHQLVAVMESGQSGHLAGNAELAKQVVGELPVIVTGAVDSLGRAAEIVAAGHADAVGMVRAHLADPDLVRKAQAGESGAIRPCVGANQGCWRRAFRAQHVTCTVNPESGREQTWEGEVEAPAARPGHVVVVGGGPGGLKAAESAARRGHAVTLLEREPELGGQLLYAGRLPGRQRWLWLVRHLADSLDRLGVECRLGHEASAASVAELGPDAIVLATGASWDANGASALRPDRDRIPCAAGGTVLTPIEAIADSERCGKRVVVVDDHGNHLAMGLAQLLAEQGREVEFVTLHPQAGIQTGVLGTADHPWVYPRLVAAGVRFNVETTVEEIDGDSVRIADVHGRGTRTLAGVGAVVTCMLRRPRDLLFAELEQIAPVERIGDCAAPREVDDAILEGARSGLRVGASVAS